jgi:hypothetical protein
MEQIITKPTTDDYRAGWERIWGSPEPSEEDFEYEVTMDGKAYRVLEDSENRAGICL